MVEVFASPSTAFPLSVVRKRRTNVLELPGASAVAQGVRHGPAVTSKGGVGVPSVVVASLFAAAAPATAFAPAPAADPFAAAALAFPSSSSKLTISSSSSPVSTTTTTAAALKTETSEIPAWKSSLADVLNGGIAGSVGKFIEFPFDTIKVRLQTQPTDPAARLYRGPWHCLKTTLKYEGVKGLYQGLSTPLLGAVVENAVLFVAYRQFSKMLQPDADTPATLPNKVLAGGLAGACVSFVLTPVELVKCRLQVQGASSRYSGPWDVVKSVVRTSGISGLFRGHMPCLARETIGGAAWFGGYELGLRLLSPPSADGQESTPSAWKLVAAGAFGGMAYNASLYPADVIKSHIQTIETKQRFWSVARDLWRAEGLRGWYRGFGITLCRAGPSNGAVFLAYEMLTRANLFGGNADKKP